MDHLYIYQKAFLSDNSKMRAVLKARQIGMSFIIALESLMHSMTEVSTTIFVSASERLATELKKKVMKHILFYQVATGHSIPLTKNTETEIEFKNGSRIISLSTNIATARSYTADYLYIDEFAFVPNNEEIYQAIAPATTRGGQITLISTPGPAKGLFFDIFNKGIPGWNTHTIDIYKAVREGLPIDIDELKAKISDPEKFAVEYECKFFNRAYNYIPVSMLKAITLNEKPELNLPYKYFIGIDIGRVHDATEIMVLGKINNKFYLIEQMELQSVPFTQQTKTIDSYIGKYNPVQVFIDSTGIGMQIAEYFEDHYGQVRGIHFTAPLKEEMASLIYNKVADKLLFIPNDEVLMDHILSVQKDMTSSGGIIFRVNSTKHHADKFWALGLALLASQEKEAKVEFNNLIY